MRKATFLYFYSFLFFLCFLGVFLTVSSHDTAMQTATPSVNPVIENESLNLYITRICLGNQIYFVIENKSRGAIDTVRGYKTCEGGN